MRECDTYFHTENMPELPEVERFRTVAQENLVGRKILEARALDDWMLKNTTTKAFERRLNGRTVTSAVRRGKHVVLFTEVNPHAPVLLLHFGMTGHLIKTNEKHPWDRLVLELDDGGHVRYRNQRRLGSIKLTERARISDEFWQLGPEPLEVTKRWFQESLAKRKAPIKNLLMNQNFIAGIGNLYADEALFAAQILPGRLASSLSAKESQKLHTTIRTTLRTALKNNSMDELPPLPLLRKRGKSNDCPRCGSPLATLKLGGRTSYFCESCQK